MGQIQNHNSIEKIDSNLRVEAGSKDLMWVDAFDKRIEIRGLAWIEENRKNKNLRRLPDRAASSVPQAVSILSHCTAGVFLSFLSNSKNISVRMQLADITPMMHMPATGMAGAELLCREQNQWYPLATVIPSPNENQFTRDVFERSSSKEMEFRLYLPLYKKVEKLEIGFEKKSKILPLSSTTPRPIFFYGTSITQGGCANTPASDYVSTVGRLLDTEVINFGFSGSGKGEPEVAELISEVDAEIFVLDHLANAPIDTLPDLLSNFIHILRAKHPNTPIVILGMPGYNQLLWNHKTQYAIDKKKYDCLRYIITAKG